MDKPENPPAFPRPGFDQPAGLQDGMSLRDHFSGQALVGIGALWASEGMSPDDIADAAYDLADAMLSARQTTDREDGK